MVSGRIKRAAGRHLHFGLRGAKRRRRPSGYLDVDYCAVAGTSNLVLTENMTELKSEVVRLMDESIAVAASDESIYSSRPAFVWASEAKVACGKAYGYLRTNYKDEDTINKCECFHSRMVEYMN